MVPVHNEVRALPGCVRVLDEFLGKEFPFPATITIVDNASTDGTFDLARRLAGEYGRVSAVRLERKGRGHALREAWRASEADILVYMDVDLSTGLNALLPLVTPLVNGHSDLAVGSRLAPGARTVRGPKRELISRAYNAVIRWTHGARFSDAQCGFKAARAEVVRPLLDRVEDDAWFFDTELLLLAEHNGLRIHEVPVDWVEDVDTRVDVVATVRDDLRGLLRVARAKAAGTALVPGLPRRPEPRAEHPDAVAATAKPGLPWQLLSFAVVGVLSTIANLVVYAVLRQWMPILVANLVALVLCTLFNTEANRRFTFFGRRGNAERDHLKGLVVFGLYYAFTSVALLGLHAFAAAPPPALEVVVLAAASLIGTVGRFLLLRGWVFADHSRQGGTLSTKASGTAGVPVTHETASPSRVPRRWQPWALGVLCAAAAVLYAWNIADGHLGNSFYSAAVKSMSSSFTNSLFGAFDAYPVSTVDKPPMSLWPQVVSVLVFGFHGWALLLPQVVEGVAAVLLLHRTVRRWAGENVALLAALILTLTPVTVAIDRDNNPDTLLVLLLVAAAYALTRSLQSGQSGSRTRWLLWCAFFLGCGFLTKMLAAWMVVPGFAVASLLGSAAPARRRILDVLAAAGVLVVSSFWWVALVDLWPGRKPYVGGSTDGTAKELVLGHDGFGRVLGEGGKTGIGRMFGADAGGQISWLLPLALLVLVVSGVLGVRAMVRGRPVDRFSGAVWVLWGSWLVVTALVFSYAHGMWHSYYTTALAPPIAAIVAAGLARFWRLYRAGEGSGWSLLPLGLAVTGAWAFVLTSRDTGYFGWTRWVVLAVTVVAVAGLVVTRLAATDRAPGRPVLARGLAVAGLVAVLLTPGVWSVATATDGADPGTIPAAGPGMSGVSGGGRVAAGRQAQPAGGERGGTAMGGDTAELTAGQRKILGYAREHSAGAAITLAVDGDAMAAAPYIIGATGGEVVIGMGGFVGTDNSPSVDQLRTWVADGTLRFVVSSAPSGEGTQAGGVARDRTSWIEEHCSEVDPSRYGGTAASGTTLRECRA
ncbi:4-amino-4-deoxy-L-arabinose transferase-like glycosyltransferase/putative flippase GtrA [Amycolatopsis bartoniae]|nr:4-amino-4-deoxy-L-arabinose transferase-like glycosyltransferase/putative flippase GtrA [Amycolatopsis bartoniae]